ncbi:Diaminopimelate epimerase [bioreactor metagenome]|uniref:diaminopimelate epimerase n=1 Tax=bioreactor metagenome TaxID=1076179 RepID=A0A645CZ09_9ZZZZ
MRFTKMQGLGNDYIYLNCLKDVPGNLPELARRLSDRHFGVGSDGLICIFPSQFADFRMDMYNADGSRGEMCGNGIRCVGKYAYDKGLTTKETIMIETLAGIKTLFLHVEDGKVATVTVDMGKPEVRDALKITVKGKDYTVIPVSMGNPHAVLFTHNIDDWDLPAVGPGFEHHEAFPNRVNTEFVEQVNGGTLRMRVWERGSGETLACGTGACAVLAAAFFTGRTGREAKIELRGGALFIRLSEEDGHIYMTGPAVTVFEGEI